MLPGGPLPAVSVAESLQRRDDSPAEQLQRDHGLTEGRGRERQVVERVFALADEDDHEDDDDDRADDAHDDAGGGESRRGPPLDRLPSPHDAEDEADHAQHDRPSDPREQQADERADEPGDGDAGIALLLRRAVTRLRRWWLWGSPHLALPPVNWGALRPGWTLRRAFLSRGPVGTPPVPARRGRVRAWAPAATTASSAATDTRWGRSTTSARATASARSGAGSGSRRLA